MSGHTFSCDRCNSVNWCNSPYCWFCGMDFNFDGMVLTDNEKDYVLKNEGGGKNKK